MYIYIIYIYYIYKYSGTVHEQFAMSLHLLCSTIIDLSLLIFSANNSAVER